MNNHEIEEAWVTWEVLTATRRALFELEEGDLPPGDPFLEYSKRLFRRIETKREDYRFLAEWDAERQGVDEEGLHEV